MPSKPRVGAIIRNAIMEGTPDNPMPYEEILRRLIEKFRYKGTAYLRERIDKAPIVLEREMGIVVESNERGYWVKSMRSHGKKSSPDAPDEHGADENESLEDENEMLGWARKVVKNLEKAIAKINRGMEPGNRLEVDWAYVREDWAYGEHVTGVIKWADSVFDVWIYLGDDDESLVLIAKSFDQILPTTPKGLLDLMDLCDKMTVALMVDATGMIYGVETETTSDLSGRNLSGRKLVFLLSKLNDSQQKVQEFRATAFPEWY
jgi:hypothetical protein